MSNIEPVTLASTTDTTYPVRVKPGVESNILALWGDNENLVIIDPGQARALRDLFNRWLSDEPVVAPDENTVGSDPVAELVFAAECGLEILQDELSQREDSGIGEETGDLSRWVDRLDAAINNVKTVS